jgi:ABC-type nitrate/sulfonate/bicarbonate transport system substrate-binding protein
MSTQHARRVSRRRFLGGLTLMATAGLLGLHAGPVAAEPPPETTRLRLPKTPGICSAPQYVAEELLYLEGFTEVQYVEVAISRDVQRHLASGALDISMTFAPLSIIEVDVEAPIVFLGGVHVGCFELFGTERVQAIRDLKGKTVAVPDQGAGITSSWPVWPSMWGWIPARTSTGSCIRPPSRCNFWPRGRSMRSWAFRRCRRSSGPRRSGTW